MINILFYILNVMTVSMKKGENAGDTNEGKAVVGSWFP